MGNIFNFKVLVVIFAIISLIFGGYVGYLSALVDKDEREFIEMVKAYTDKQILEKQLARAQSILDARKRAYIRRSQEFIQKKQSEFAERTGLNQDAETLTVTQMENAVNEARKMPGLTAEDQKELKSLTEERQDVGFFEDEVATIDQMLARGFNEEELNLAMAEIKARKAMTGSLRKLLQLLDKRKEIAVERDQAREQYDYWEKHPKEAPRDLVITVKNKGVVPRELNPLHVTQITTAMSAMPQGFDSRIRTLYIVYGDPQMRRGMSGVGVVFMKGEESDFFRVLVHEFGHVWDLHREFAEGTKSEFYDGQYRLLVEDPSVTYYRYSWKTSSERAVADKDAYASSYGYTDPFEDFAEAYALYVLQGNTFKTWKVQNAVLAKKYDFLSDIFNGRTYKSSEIYNTRPYDVTMLAVNYEEVLGF